MSGFGRRRMEIYLKQGHTFPVPVTVADHLLGLANHDQLKVLLYLLCHADESLTAEIVAQKCKVQPDVVEEAIAFWQDANVLSGASELPAVHLQNAVRQPQTSLSAQTPQPASNPAPVAKIQNSSSQYSLMPSEIAARIRENETIAAVFRSIEQLIGRMPNNTEMKSMIWMHEYLGLEPDLILMLAAYCVQFDCFHVRYMEKIAIEWQERGIMTHTLAEQDIRRRTESRSYTAQIMRMFEMKRQPTELQQSFIDDWQLKGWSMEMIQLAYEKTRNQTDDKLNFNYLNGILKKWESDGIRTISEALKQDDAYYAARKQKRDNNSKKAPTGSTNSSIDMDIVEKLMNPFGA